MIRVKSSFSSTPLERSMCASFSFFSGSSFLYNNLPSLKFRFIKGINCIHTFGFIFHFNKTKTF